MTTLKTPKIASTYNASKDNLTRYILYALNTIDNLHNLLK